MSLRKQNFTCTFYLIVAMSFAVDLIIWDQEVSMRYHIHLRLKWITTISTILDFTLSVWRKTSVWPLNQKRVVCLFTWVIHLTSGITFGTTTSKDCHARNGINWIKHSQMAETLLLICPKRHGMRSKSQA